MVAVIGSVITGFGTKDAEGDSKLQMLDLEVFMGDKSPKSKQKDDKQKQAKGKADAAKAQAKQQPKTQPKK
ncbi:MAG TPA: hypothetical protein PK156_09595 [Polyangium sp.]|nr:hypothetical protein [Polyangium sp.]